jgi:hypothetical protein
MKKVYLDITKATGTVRVCRDTFRGHPLVDLRHYYKPEGETDLVPTKRGVAIAVRDLPRMRAALEEAEADALREGLLEEQDYEVAGLAVPVVRT